MLLQSSCFDNSARGDTRAWQNLRSRIRLLARSSEDKMGHAGFKVPIYDRQSSQIEGGVRAHHHEQPARDHEDRAVHEAGDYGLFYASKSLAGIMVPTKP